jgi:hypothetical protein
LDEFTESTREKMTEPITCKLNRLADYEVQKMLIEADKQNLIDSVLTYEIKIRLAEIDTEFAEVLKSADQEIENLTKEIKTDVLDHKESVKGLKYQAIYSNGSVTWNTDALDGYALSHPEILPLRKPGKPSVSIRGVK